ncbi:unnamed protein product [Symbiodinium pilosum]|uniref:Uncharacterized protein n=1 Tax=Symbiodinium pilosum TaxID=2952 RepID=A0A812IRQ6_SYMPI|nr:unnamed protein product [Symbiodinium pilosum]
MAFATTHLTRNEERGLSAAPSLESFVTGLCFIICSASCTILTDCGQAKTWLCLGACGCCLMFLLALRAMQGRQATKAAGKVQDVQSSQSKEALLSEMSDMRAQHPKLLTKRVSKFRHFDGSVLQVIHENATLAVKAIECKDLPRDKIAMIIAAVYSLTTQRKKWGKRPDETWGTFLTKLDTILTRHSKSSQPSVLMPPEAWYEISCWCSRHSPQKLQSIVETAIKLHKAPGQEVVWELARMLDTTLDAAQAV